MMNIPKALLPKKLDDSVALLRRTDGSYAITIQDEQVRGETEDISDKEQKREQ
jgi:hypothetical protein